MKKIMFIVCTILILGIGATKFGLVSGMEDKSDFDIFFNNFHNNTIDQKVLENDPWKIPKEEFEPYDPDYKAFLESMGWKTIEEDSDVVLDEFARALFSIEE